MFLLEELADRLGLSFSGDPHRRLTSMASLASAGPMDLSYHHPTSQLDQLASTQAGAVIISPSNARVCPADQLLTEDPYLTFARASGLFAAKRALPAVVHSGAHVDPGAELLGQVSIGPGAVVEASAKLHPGVRIGGGAFVGRGSVVGAGSIVGPNAVIHHDVVIGERCVVHSQAVLGGEGFGFARSDAGWERIHHLGGVRLGDRVEIGSCTTVDRGTLDDTVIEDDVIIDNLVQIAHNCRIGRGSAIAACSGLAGSTVIGAHCTLAGGVGVVGHVEICDNVHVTGMTMVTRSIRQAGSYSSGTGMAATRDWKQSAARFRHLDSIARRLTAVEKRHKTQ
ncbi:MAG: UDP-3-O-(3-hydroxymyristoyl)glucosamine N-acyltransferase [Pseudomonadota bacterium]